MPSGADSLPFTAGRAPGNAGERGYEACDHRNPDVPCDGLQAFSYEQRFCTSLEFYGDCKEMAYKPLLMGQPTGFLAVPEVLGTWEGGMVTVSGQPPPKSNFTRK